MNKWKVGVGQIEFSNKDGRAEWKFCLGKVLVWANNDKGEIELLGAFKAKTLKKAKRQASIAINDYLLKKRGWDG